MNTHYRATRDVAEQNWTKGQEHITLTDTDAKKWLNNGALVKMTTSGKATFPSTPDPLPPTPLPGVNEDNQDSQPPVTPAPAPILSPRPGPTTSYRVTRNVPGKGWIEGQHIPLTDADAKSFLGDGSLVPG